MKRLKIKHIVLLLTAVLIVVVSVMLITGEKQDAGEDASTEGNQTASEQTAEEQIDLGQFGEQPLLVLCPQALTQLGRA